VTSFLRALLHGGASGQKLINIVVEDAARGGLAVAVAWYVAGRVSGDKLGGAQFGFTVGYIAGMQDFSMAVSLAFAVIGGVFVGFVSRLFSLP
jgi:hypothetical protein